MESVVERALAQLLALGTSFDYAAVKSIAAPEPLRIPHVHIGAADLSVYDGLLATGTR